ncbi:MAG TPA: ribosome silencing factor [Candidatus Hypogeohydataceae bacterium YC41]
MLYFEVRGTLEPKEIAKLFAQIADNKKAEDILVLDLRKITFITEFFVICSGINSRQLQAIADEIVKQTEEKGIRRLAIEGYREARWILLDYGDVIIHIFDKEARHFYDLELLWGDAPRVKWHPSKVAKRK